MYNDRRIGVSRGKRDNDDNARGRTSGKVSDGPSGLSIALTTHHLDREPLSLSLSASVALLARYNV